MNPAPEDLELGPGSWEMICVEKEVKLVIGEQLTSAQGEQLQGLIRNFGDVFTEEPGIA